MPTSTLDARTRLSIEKAVTGHRGDPAQIRQQDRDAMRLGLCGAEIDAACTGRSFDRRIMQAIELALAAVRSDTAWARLRAILAGFSEAARREIKDIAETHVIDAGSCSDDQAGIHAIYQRGNGHLLYEPRSSSKAPDYYRELLRDGCAWDTAGRMRIL